MTESVEDPTLEIAKQFIQMINAGDLDDFVKLIAKACEIRRTQLQRQVVSSLCIGDQIRLVDSIKPAMLANIIVEVVDFDNKKGTIKVKLLRTYSQKWRMHGIVNITPALVGEKVL